MFILTLVALPAANPVGRYTIKTNKANTIQMYETYVQWQRKTLDW